MAPVLSNADVAEVLEAMNAYFDKYYKAIRVESNDDDATRKSKLELAKANAPDLTERLKTVINEKIRQVAAVDAGEEDDEAVV